MRLTLLQAELEQGCCAYVAGGVQAQCKLGASPSDAYSALRLSTRRIMFTEGLAQEGQRVPLLNGIVPYSP